MIASTAGWASLGGPVSSIEKDGRVLRGETRVLERGKVSIHEIRADGTQVREYARPDGTVFAVTWRGPAEPDLEALLGRFYRGYAKAEAESALVPHRGRRKRVVDAQGVVVEKSGHMRDIRGKAYVPALLPPGFGAEEIR